MQANRVLQVLGILCALLPGAVLAQEKQMDAPVVDYDALARSLVVENARIREGDKVLITGSVRDIELLEDLAVQARAVGAHPFIQIGSERMTKRMFDDVPEKYDAQSPDFNLALADIVNVWIDVPIDGAPNLLAHVPPARFATRSAAFEPVARKFRERGVRTIELGNGLYPTAWRADRFGIAEADLAEMFWSGVNADYAALQTTGEAIRSRIAAGDELRITHPDGTDLRMQISARPVLVSDGVISAEDEAKGGAAVQLWLPAGDIFLTPVPGSATGTVVVDQDFFEDTEIRNLELTFADGKLVSMTADSGLERLQELYDSGDASKDIFGIVNIGINPNLRVAGESHVEAWSPAGMVAVGFGNTTWAGGENASNFGWSGFLPGATLTVDGETIVENGVLEP